MNRWIFGLLLLTFPAWTAPVQSIETLPQAKQILLTYVHTHHPYTVYCGATYNEYGELTLPTGFNAAAVAYRSDRLEVEHMVPAENFGRNIDAWEKGAPECVNENGAHYDGRRCAEKVSKPFRVMLTDMYNLYPSIGSVNGIRQNYPFGILHKSTHKVFHSCPFKIEDGIIEPPETARGVIGRTYLYFENEYAPLFQMTDETRNLMTSWNETYPVKPWECERARKIEKIQKNENKYVKEPCLKAGFWKEK